MCIMEVRPGQHSCTIAQALAHNTSTIERDMDMFKPLVAARGETELLAQLETAHDHLRRAYANLLAVFAEEVAAEVQDAAGHIHHDDGHGHERSFVEVADAQARLARRFETR